MPTVDSSNSYLAESAASTYFAERLHASDWSGASESDQQKALLMACRLLERRVLWHGVKTDDEQSLQWPRRGCLDENGLLIDENTTPGAVQDCQCELALLLLGRDLLALPDAAGETISEVVGEIEVEYRPGTRPATIPDQVFEIIAHLGKRTGKPGSVTVRLA